MNTMLEQTPAPPVPAGGTRWQTRYAPGAEPASFAGSCRPVRSLSQGTLQLVCADAGSSEVVQYQFAVPGARAGVPTFSVETGPTSSGLVSTSIGRVANGRLMLTVRVRGKGVVDIRSVSIGFYGRG